MCALKYYLFFFLKSIHEFNNYEQHRRDVPQDLHSVDISKLLNA
jgi:hypothetical protein